MRTTILFCLFVFTTSTPARADVSSDVYADFKTIIEDVITKEVAETTTEEIACRAGHALVEKSDTIRYDTVEIAADEHYELLALEFYPRTLQNLYAGQFGGLRSSFIDESADLAGYLVYRVLTDDDLGATAKRIEGMAEQDLQKTKYNGLTLLVTRMSPTNNAQFGKLDNVAFGLIQNSQDKHATCKKKVLEKLQQGLIGASSKLDSVCSHLQPPPKDNEKTPAPDTNDTYACELALALRSSIRTDKELAARHLARALAAFASYTFASEAENALDLGVTDTIALELLNLRKPDALPSTFADNVVKAIGATDDASRKQKLVRLGTAWKLLIDHDSGRVDLAQVSNIFTTNSSELAGVCGDKDHVPKPKAAAKACGTLKRLTDQVLSSQNSGLLLPLISAAGRGDLRETVHITLSSILRAKRDRSECEDSQRCTRDLYERFTESVAAYVVDAAQSSTPNADIRAAFRAAAEEVVREAWPGGYDRGGHWHVRPDLSLRASFNQGYTSNSGSSFRKVASIAWPVLRIPFRAAPTVFFGMNLSFFDLAGPFAEFALRPSSVGGLETRWKGSEKVFYWNFVAPRVAFELGLPTFSSHLMLDVGISGRPVVPYNTGTVMEDNTMKQQYTYRSVSDSNAEMSRSIEVSVGVKYAP